MKNRPLFLIVSLLFVSSVGAEPPERLTVLKEAYQREIKRVMAPVDQKYEGALVRLQDSFTKEGKLDQALAVRNEIKKLEAGNVSIAENGDGGEKEASNEAAGNHKDWKGDGRKSKDGETPVISLRADGKDVQKITHSIETEKFPPGMRLNFRYKSADYEGAGFELRGYNTDTGFFHRAVPMKVDGEWHEYSWPYKAEYYKGASEIRFEIQVLQGDGTVLLEGMTITPFTR